MLKLTKSTREVNGLFYTYSLIYPCFKFIKLLKKIVLLRKIDVQLIFL